MRSLQLEALRVLLEQTALGRIVLSHMALPFRIDLAHDLNPARRLAEMAGLQGGGRFAQSQTPGSALRLLAHRISRCMRSSASSPPKTLSWRSASRHAK